MRSPFALLGLALLAPLAAGEPLPPEAPALAQDHCSGAAKPTECVATLQKIAGCRVHLVGYPPSFITFPRPDAFGECVEKAHP